MTDDNRDPVEALTELRFIGPATAEIIADAEFGAEQFRSKRVSYRMLVEAGANPGVATRIRREHSLPWSITGSSSDDLDKRSDQVRGLQDDERAWVAASTGDWETENATASGAEADGGGETDVAEAAWRERSRPDPVTDVAGVTEEIADKLANAGINSVRSLATADPESVSDVLGFDEEEVAAWRDAAAELS